MDSSKGYLQPVNDCSCCENGSINNDNDLASCKSYLRCTCTLPLIENHRKTIALKHVTEAIGLLQGSPGGNSHNTKLIDHVSVNLFKSHLQLTKYIFIL